MAVNVNNAFVGAPPIDGGVYFNAPLGTKLPKKANEALDPAFKDHGAVGEDGISVTPTRESTTERCSVVATSSISRPVMAKR